MNATCDVLTIGACQYMGLCKKLNEWQNEPYQKQVLGSEGRESVNDYSSGLRAHGALSHCN